MERLLIIAILASAMLFPNFCWAQNASSANLGKLISCNNMLTGKEDFWFWEVPGNLRNSKYFYVVKPNAIFKCPWGTKQDSQMLTDKGQLLGSLESNNDNDGGEFSFHPGKKSFGSDIKCERQHSNKARNLAEKLVKKNLDFYNKKVRAKLNINNCQNVDRAKLQKRPRGPALNQGIVK